MDICAEHTDKLEKHLRLTMEVSVDEDSNVASPKSSTIESPLTNRSLTGAFQVNRQELIEKVNQLKQKWKQVMRVAISALLDEIYEDINKHLEQVMTRAWYVLCLFPNQSFNVSLFRLTNLGSPDLETICVTINDYHTDYEHLRPHIRFSLLNEIYYKIVGEYIIAMDSRCQQCYFLNAAAVSDD